MGRKEVQKGKKAKIMGSLFPGEWTFELVVNNVKSEEELQLIEGEGIKLIRLSSMMDR